MMSVPRDSAIGIFDSGVGGLGTLKTIRQVLPHENIIYYGDDKNAPYGTKDVAQIRKLSENCVRFLLEKGAKAIVVACNTASSAAVEYLRKTFSLPIVAMEPAVRPAKAQAGGKKVLVMATQATLSLARYQSRIEELHMQAQVVSLPCPSLVMLVERGVTKGPEATAEVEKLLLPYRAEEVGVVVLGCTHYVHIRETIEQVAKRIWPEVTVMDGNLGTANWLKHVLEERGLLNPQKEEGSIAFYTSYEQGGMMDVFSRLMAEEQA